MSGIRSQNLSGVGHLLQILLCDHDRDRLFLKLKEQITLID